MTRVANGRILPDDVIDPSQIELNLQVLYEIVGTYYSFNGTAHMLPDLRGEFVRGWSDGRVNVDDGRSLGEFQQQAVQSHYHQGPAGAADTETNATNKGGGDRTGVAGIYSTNASGAEGTSGNEATFKAGVAETRPRNIALLYCIKT